MSENEPPFTPEEIAKLRALLPYAEAVREEAEYDAAVRLIVKRWKGIVIGAAAVVAAVIYLWNNGKSALQSIFGA